MWRFSLQSGKAFSRLRHQAKLMDDPKAQPFYSCIHNIKVIQPVAIWLAWGCSRQAMRCFLGNCPLVEGGRDTVFHLRRRVLYKSLWLSTSCSFINCTLFGCVLPIAWLKEKPGYLEAASGRAVPQNHTHIRQASCASRIPAFTHIQRWWVTKMQHSSGPA